MKHYWNNKNKRYGFYLSAEFNKGKIGKYMITKEKPFDIDNITGEVNGKCMRCIPKNFFASEWEFFEGSKISDIDRDVFLRESINMIWRNWCKKYNRKYKPILNIDGVRE